MPNLPPSYPADAGYPVRRGLSILSSASLEYWIARLRGRRQLRVWRSSQWQNTTLHSRDTLRPSFAKAFRPEGAGNAGRPMRPIAACAMIVIERTRVSQVTPESPGIPHAMVYGLLRALPGAPGFLATVACATSRRLDTSVGVSGPHAFSVRLKRPRQKRHQRPPHPAPRL